MHSQGLAYEDSLALVKTSRPSNYFILLVYLLYFSFFCSIYQFLQILFTSRDISQPQLHAPASPFSATEPFIKCLSDWRRNCKHGISRIYAITSDISNQQVCFIIIKYYYYHYMSFKECFTLLLLTDFHYLFPGEHRIPSSCFAEDPSVPLSSDDTAQEQQSPENQYALHLT